MKLLVSCDSETDVEVDVLDIVPNSTNKIGGKKVLMNTHVSPLDNASFHYEESVNKWKFVFQRSVSFEKIYMIKDTLECPEI